MIWLMIEVKKRCDKVGHILPDYVSVRQVEMGAISTGCVDFMTRIIIMVFTTAFVLVFRYHQIHMNVENYLNVINMVR